MKEDKLLQIFNEDTSGKNYTDGQRVFNNDLVASIEITSEESLICIDGNVISENLFNEYITKIEIDTAKNCILTTFCSCQDYEKNEFRKKNYCCNHLVAAYYKALPELIKHPLIDKEDFIESETLNNGNKVLNMLLDNDENKEKIKIEIYINKDPWNEELLAEFKIGLAHMSSSNLYVIKDLNHFFVSLHNKAPIVYSKNFTFDITKQNFSSENKRLLDFIETINSTAAGSLYSNRTGNKAVESKYIRIPGYLVRQFFDIIKNHRVYLNEGFFYRPVETEILQQHPPVDFDMKIIKGNYVLKSNGGMPVSLSEKNDILLYGASIYMPDYEFCYKLIPFLHVFSKAKVVTLPGTEEETILRKLIPELNKLSENVILSKIIKDKIVLSQCLFNFYFDKENMEITLVLKVKYGAYEFNIYENCTEKVIFRDTKLEAEAIALLRNLGFEQKNGIFYLLKDEKYVFQFFKNDIEKLQKIGEVFYSQNFKAIKPIGKNGIIGEIKPGKYDYFKLEFKISDILPGETAKILRAFRDNLKYYKLKSGEFIDLEEIELKKFLKLLDSLADEEIVDNSISINRNRSMYLNSYMENENLRYIKGKKQVNEIVNKLKKIETHSFEEPNGLTGNLRQYQKIGFNWLKTLDYLGFGGILADEMGLGKTLQTIAFILSNKYKKTLIVAPTSLVYNWVSEFKKFAPSIKTASINGSREERVKIIDSYMDYDVLITTYNLLRRDLEVYKTIEFHYCVLDEAQNIKNSNSQIAAAVKEIKAQRRFALSGTPIENSLMELWSIFDFIMPGYLYDEKRFSVRYHKRLREEPEVIEELNKLIKPFILRRRKKDVIKELPDKIEKVMLVDLEDEQKKVYKIYADHALELIQKKVKDEEFNNSKIEILAYLTKLRLLCLDPSVVMEEYLGGSGKLEALLELIKDSIAGGHKILVFSQFTSVLKNIIKRISPEGISFSYLDGSIPASARMKLVNEFNEGPNSVFFISLKAGGTGLNLTSADIVIHFDPWWNPAVEEQAADRAHRIGQKNVVEVIKIIAKGTIEERILSLQSDKKKLISELMGDDIGDGSGFSNLSEEELLSLFEENIPWV